MQEFSLIIAAKRKLCEYYTIHFSMRAQSLCQPAPQNFPLAGKHINLFPGPGVNIFFSYLQHGYRLE